MTTQKYKSSLEKEGLSFPQRQGSQGTLLKINGMKKIKYIMLKYNHYKN